MKKIIIVLVTLTLSLTACADRHQQIEYSELPVQAQAFIQRFFDIAEIAYIEREYEGMLREYNVHMRNATEIEFNHQGNLKSIDCHISAVPNGIVPEVIKHYVTLHFPDSIIVEYVIESRRMKIELGTGIELLFDLEGNFLGIDD